MKLEVLGLKKSEDVSIATDKEKKTRWLVYVNIIAISVLLCLFILMIYNKRISKNISSENIATTNENVEEKMNTGMVDMYSSILAGWSYTLEDGETKFSFGMDNSYSGFFDADNKNVVDYSYDISFDDSNSGAYMLNIYNKDKSKVVSYMLALDSDGNILLTYPGSESSFVLSVNSADVILE